MEIIKKIINLKWKELILLLRQAHKKTKRSYYDLLEDLYSCYKEGFICEDYFIYNFHSIKDKDYRSSFVVEKIHNRFIMRFFNESQKEINEIWDKGLFNRKFNDIKGIETLDLRIDNIEKFNKFIEKHNKFLIKTPTSSGGHEVKRKNRKDYEKYTTEELYKYLKEKNYVVIEEMVNQNKWVSNLSLDSVNTLRIVTVKNINGTISAPFIVSKISVSKEYTDSSSFGGAYCIVNKEGKIKHNYFSYFPRIKEFSKHPITGFEFYDYQFPYFKEAIELCVVAAKRSKLHYIGWDVAISETGPVLIEGNTSPGAALFQAYTQLDNNRGRLKELEEGLGIKLKV